MTTATTSVSAAATTPPCETLLFEKTQTTAGETPEQFFGALRTPDGAPRYVQLIGVPGSGKSTWSRVALRMGWVVLSTDALRVQALEQMRDRGEKLQLADGSLVTPEPHNPAHIFCPFMLKEGFVQLRRERDAAFARGQSIVDDKLNMNLHRVDDLVAARDRGYQTEALAFAFSDPQTVRKNLALRAERGGFNPNPAVIDRTLRDFAFFSGKLREIPRAKAPPATPLEQWESVRPGQWGRLAERAATDPRAEQDFDRAIQTLPLEERVQVQRARNEDYYHRVAWTPVRSQ